MVIKKLELNSFRNYECLEIEFSQSYNVIYGQNGQGKTNIVEALFFCSAARSHRTNKDVELIKEGMPLAKMQLHMEREGLEKEIQIVLSRNERKKIKINEIPQKKIGNLIGCLNVVLFSPEDLMIIKEGPSLRRKFIDISISQLRPRYFKLLVDYLHVLHQKSALLKENNDPKKTMELLDVWNTSLAAYGAKIMKERETYIQKLSLYAKENHLELTGGKEQLEVRYISSINKYAKSTMTKSYTRTTSHEEDNIDKHENMNEEKNMEEHELTEMFYEKLKDNMQSEMRRGACLVGVQRDDYVLCLDGRDSKVYGSQGQQRTAILSAKLAEINVVNEEIGDNPILLLDDVMSELDSDRRSFLLKRLRDIQTVITCTDKQIYEGKLSGDETYIAIRGGKKVEEDETYIDIGDGKKVEEDETC